jgi:NAD(P)-dependent dehydrogenase (short-subunit alcohol dehydrogenase family)
MLTGLKVLITGASSGIGKSTAAVMTRHGAVVYGVGRNQQSLEEMLSENILAGFVCADLTMDNECSRVVASAVECMSGLTTVVNSAGVLQGGAMDVATLDNFKFNFAANVQTAFEIMQHSIPHLKACGKESSPSIINISSVNGKQAFRGCATYCASKAALDQLSRCASLDLAPFNIRVNVVNPGVVETPLQRRGGMTGRSARLVLNSIVCTQL